MDAFSAVIVFCAGVATGAACVLGVLLDYMTRI
jgi:hypothetical protein